MTPAHDAERHIKLGSIAYRVNAAGGVQGLYPRGQEGEPTVWMAQWLPAGSPRAVEVRRLVGHQTAILPGARGRQPAPFTERRPDNVYPTAATLEHATRTAR